MDFEIRRADLANDRDAEAVAAMIERYAKDPFGANAELPADVRERLIPGLREHPTTVPILAFDAERPVGIALCFLGFSSFAARRLLNLHDLFVAEEARGRGLGRALLEGVADEARKLGAAKVTLEVLVGNARARGVYDAAGFLPGRDAPPEDWTLFLTRPLD